MDMRPQEESPAAYVKYAEYRQKYDETIYRAWFVGKYRLSEQTASRASGTVWGATDVISLYRKRKLLHYWSMSLSASFPDSIARLELG
jgi:hypothetical protein